MDFLLALALLLYCLGQRRGAPPHRQRVQGWFVLLAAAWLWVQLVWGLLPFFTPVRSWPWQLFD